MIHLGTWQDAAWPEQVDCIITDPPYSERVHGGHNDGTKTANKIGHAFKAQLDYSSLTHEQAREWGEQWGRRVSTWLVIMCDHDLWNAWRAGAMAAGLYTFAPVFCGIAGMTVRVAADGPASWGVWMLVARTSAPAVGDYGRSNDKGQRVRGWGSLPGYYHTQRDPGYIGGKPLPLMQQIVRDYSRPGMLVADPCAGHATTLVAALQAGRRVWGAECDPAAHAAAVARLERVTAQPQLITETIQPELL
jgi:site-specific DNA-methyltransferase (adenine-specific)